MLAPHIHSCVKKRVLKLKEFYQIHSGKTSVVRNKIIRKLTFKYTVNQVIMTHRKLEIQ